MKFTSALTITLLTLAKLIVADSESFGLLSIRSGSNLQYASVYYNNDKLYVGSGATSEALSAVVTDAGKLKFNNDGSRYIVVSSDGTLTEGPEDDGSEGFSIKDGHLIYNNVDGFYAIPEGSAYVLSTKGSDNSVGIAIRATASNGQTVPDFTPAGGNDTITTLSSPSAAASTSSSEAVSTTASGESSSSTVAVESASATAAAISQINDGQIQAIQTENGAPRAVVGMGAGIAAAAAALLL